MRQLSIPSSLAVDRPVAKWLETQSPWIVYRTNRMEMGVCRCGSEAAIDSYTSIIAGETTIKRVVRCKGSKPEVKNRTWEARVKACPPYVEEDVPIVSREWAESVKARCKQKGLSYADLAKLANLSRATLQNALNRKQSLSNEAVAAIDAALDGVAEKAKEPLDAQLHPDFVERARALMVKHCLGTLAMVELFSKIGKPVSPKTFTQALNGKTMDDVRLNTIEMAIQALEGQPASFFASRSANQPASLGDITKIIFPDGRTLYAELKSAEFSEVANEVHATMRLQITEAHEMRRSIDDHAIARSLPCCDCSCHGGVHAQDVGQE